MSEVTLYSDLAQDQRIGGIGHGLLWKQRAVQRFRGGLVFKAHILCVSLYSRRESNEEEEETEGGRFQHPIFL